MSATVLAKIIPNGGAYTEKKFFQKNKVECECVTMFECKKKQTLISIGSPSAF